MFDIGKKQYLLSSKELKINNFTSIKLSFGYLYLHNKLKFVESKTADGKKVVLIGNAFCSDVVGKKIEDDITSFSGKKIEEITRFWTGRFVLITEQELVTDATSLMSAFYIQKNNEWFISSSLALISSVTHTVCDGEVSEDGIGHIILPKTLNTNVEKLIPGYKLLLDRDYLKTTAISCFTDKTDMTTEEKCKAVAKMLCTGLKNIQNFSGRKIVLALTGGKDSRLTFAAMLKAGVKFSCYTAEHNNISSSDKGIPEKLCEKYGIPYTYIKSQSIDKEKLTDYKEFTAGNTKGADQHFYSRGQLDELPKDSVIIRSGIFEAGQIYARGYTSCDTNGFIIGMKLYYGKSFSQKQSEAFYTWLEMIKEKPLPFIDIRDRYYIEQRVGGWASAIEQSLDMNDFVSIQIANCPEIISVLLSASNEERANLTLTYETIKYLYPEVLEFDINKRTFFDQLRLIVNVFSNPNKIIDKLSKLLKRR